MPRSLLYLLHLLHLLHPLHLIQGQTSQQNGMTVPTECLPPKPDIQISPVEGPGKADILFIVDTSGSMGSESTNVINNLNAFGQHLEDEGIDYRVILIGQDQSCCSLCVQPPLASSACSTTGPKFRKLEQYIFSTDACDRFLQPTIYGSTTFNSFLRADAAKTIVFVSDDDITGTYGCFQNDCRLTKAQQWLDQLQAQDTSNEYFKPTVKLPHGIMVHTIDGHTCNGEPGYSSSYTYVGLAEITGGTNFKLCQADWTSYFSTIAGAVADSTIGTKCEYDIPRSTTDPALIVGNLEPDTPFLLTFEYDTDGTGPSTDTTILTFVQSPTNTCKESSCSYAADPCVCSMRCPVGYTRDGTDASKCVRPSQPTCSLAHCHSTSANSALPNCALDSTERLFVVDDPSDPRKAIFCSQTCHLVRSFTQGGDLKFDFRPVAKLRSMTVGGRGKSAQASFGQPKTLHPALAFPTGHPATTRTDCGGAASRPTIPKTGPALFDSPNCSPSTGEDMFYALDPSTGRSKTFEVGAGLMIFFLVNAVGESYLGIQIGQYPNAAAAAAASTTPVAAGYGVIDIILSGDTVKNMQPRPSWVVQDGGGGSNFGNDDISNGKKGRVLVSNIVGKTAGGILGPLPAYDFCVDLIVVEASGSVNSASIVNFDTSSSTPARPEQFMLSGDFMEEGGMRFCANKCNGDVVTESESRNSVTCWTNAEGTTFCPAQGDPGPDQATTGGDTNGKNGNGNSNTPSSSSEINGKGGNDTTTSPSSKAIDDYISMHIIIIFTSIGCFLCCVIIVAFVLFRIKRNGINGKGDKTAVGIYEMTSKETMGKKRRSTFSVKGIGNSDWELVLDPASGDQYYFNHVTLETSWDAPEEVQSALVYAKKEASFGRTSVTLQASTGDWYPFVTEDGHTAFANSVSGEVVWEIPQQDDVGKGYHQWVPFETEDGYTAYRNEATGQVSWENPARENNISMMSNPMTSELDINV